MFASGVKNKSDVCSRNVGNCYNGNCGSYCEENAKSPRFQWRAPVQVSEFLTAQQVASFSSGMAAKIKQQTTPEETLSDQDILAMEDEQNICNGCIVFAAPNKLRPV